MQLTDKSKVADTYGFDTPKGVAETGEVAADLPPAGYPQFKQFEMVKVKGHNFQVWDVKGRQITLRYIPLGSAKKDKKS